MSIWRKTSMTESNKNNMSTSKKRAYYLEPVKFIRDIVHSYVYLTKFDLDLIDTPEFQRLKDIRQLTCQNVYPSARHTRFEHSLGVLELTRQAMKNLNKNGIISSENTMDNVIFNDYLQFNAGVAALLHDVGHCPFSHMGESEFNKEEVWNRLFGDIIECNKLKDSALRNEIIKFNKDNKLKKPGSVHEQLGCIVILETYYDKLKDAGWFDETDKNSAGFIDFELIIRSIIGLEYDTSTIELYNENKRKNIVVRLINSPVFDMDKLDYIMRDSLFTAIGIPQIDTKRLFKNMFLKSEQEYDLVFTHRAEPVLQNMIEARDKLYMYVYNHHAAVFSDFIYSYIFRKLTRNNEVFNRIVDSFFTNSVLTKLRENYVQNEDQLSENIDDMGDEELKRIFWQKSPDPRTNIGVVPQSYLFSTDAVVVQKRSDSDMISLLHDIHYMLEQQFNLCDENISIEKALDFAITVEVEKELQGISGFDKIEINEMDKQYMIENIQRIYTLIDHYQGRKFLKPWWKTNFEFTDFINHNFRDDHVRQQLCTWICQEATEQPAGDEFRSQLAKHVIYITQQIYRRESDGAKKIYGLLEPLTDGDFFVIKRAAHFYKADAISQLDIALKNSEIIGSPNQVKASTKDFYIKELPNVSPIRDYYSFYPRESFYIFSKQLGDGFGDPNKRSRHYQTIEQIFVFVATELIQEGALEFQKRFKDCDKEDVYQNEQKSMQKLLEKYVEYRGGF